MRLLILLSAFLPVLAAGEVAPPSMTEFNVSCPAQELLPKLRAAFLDCRTNSKSISCTEFVGLYRELVPVYDCQRPFDHTTEKDYVVPAIWLAVDSDHELYIELLSRIPSAEAKCLFASAELRKTLDGHLAEMYGAESERRQIELGKSCK